MLSLHYHLKLLVKKEDGLLNVAKPDFSAINLESLAAPKGVGF